MLGLFLSLEPEVEITFPPSQDWVPEMWQLSQARPERMGKVAWKNPGQFSVCCLLSPQILFEPPLCTRPRWILTVLGGTRLVFTSQALLVIKILQYSCAD